jgi:hypothetical protein
MKNLKRAAVSKLISASIAGLILVPQITFANAFRCIDAHATEALTASAPRAPHLAAALERLRQTESFILVNHQGLPLAVQLTRPAHPDLPYLLLEPGARRPLYPNELGYMALVNKGYGVVSFSYSRQPFSLQIESSEGRSPIRNTDLKFEDLIKETNLVTQSLAEMGIHNVIPVSLSFSSSISPYIKGYPLVIETAPMTSWAAAVPNPNLVKNRKMLQAWQLWNPFFGPAIVRHQLDDVYRKNWEEGVDAEIKKLGLDPKKRSEYLDGWTQLTRSAEDRDWSQVQLSPETRRVFMVSLFNESPRLLRSQLETYQKQVMGLREDNLLIAIRDTGHFIPIQTPLLFAGIIDMILSHPDHIKGGLLLIGSTIDDVRYISDPKEAAHIIQQMINTTIEDEAIQAKEPKTK